MDLKSKRKRELDIRKKKRRKEIIKVALEVFKEKGIDNTKMTDVAKKAEFGVATLYRYFNTKADLVIETATLLWDEEINVINNMLNEKTFTELKAIKRVRKILELFLDIYYNHQDTLSFLEQFDNYIVKENIPEDKLENYEENVINIKESIIKAINEGKIDGSIRKDIDVDVFYVTITHSLMSLCQKLVLRGKILTNDNVVKENEQIQLLIDMAIDYISN
ncbi:MAG: helix-turn-helix transcriptional regulator [Firmicutes bacterium]|nr:helix-turn-helix transcriptional regulator [Bacillota bacterium]